MQVTKSTYCTKDREVAKYFPSLIFENRFFRDFRGAVLV